MKKGKVKVNKQKIIIIIAVLFILIVGIYLFRNKMLQNQTTYVVTRGYVEKAIDASAIIVKDEKVIDIENKSALITNIEQGTRVPKDGVIAIYKNEKYSEYLNSINELDLQIETLIKDLPPTYSSEISNIDEQISNIVIKSKNTNSYVKMHEYKLKLDELSTKKVNILASLSPTGSKITELIQKRDELKNNSNITADTIKAPISGMVTYKIDQLEDIIDYGSILNFNANDISNYFEKYRNNNVNNFGIKIIDNFNAYIIAKIDDDNYDEYIIEGKNYKLTLNNASRKRYSANLIKYIKAENGRYAIFYIQNGIEQLVDSRIESVEITWKETSGMAVIKDAIYKATGGYDYVTLVYGGNYIDIPVKVIEENENVVIVNNFEDSDYEKYNIEKEYVLDLYDILVVKNEDNV